MSYKAVVYSKEGTHQNQNHKGVFVFVCFVLFLNKGQSVDKEPDLLSLEGPMCMYMFINQRGFLCSLVVSLR